MYASGMLSGFCAVDEIRSAVEAARRRTCGYPVLPGDLRVRKTIPVRGSERNHANQSTRRRRRAGEMSDDRFRFEFDAPVLRSGSGAAADLGAELAEHGFERALVVCGSTVGRTPAVVDP